MRAGTGFTVGWYIIINCKYHSGVWHTRSMAEYAVKNGHFRIPEGSSYVIAFWNGKRWTDNP